VGIRKHKLCLEKAQLAVIKPYINLRQQRVKGGERYNYTSKRRDPILKFSYIIIYSFLTLINGEKHYRGQQLTSSKNKRALGVKFNLETEIKIN
jgi:hypothetical protein